jgi:hypothetical protein
LLPDDIEKIETSIKAQIPQESSSFVFLLGPTLTGKTRAGKVLSELGMKSIDFLAIIEDTKQRLSTEEEPKEDLTFSEIIEGIQFEAKKNPAKVFLLTESLLLKSFLPKTRIIRFLKSTKRRQKMSWLMMKTLQYKKK